MQNLLLGCQGLGGRCQAVAIVLLGCCQGVCYRWLLTSPNPTSSLYENLIPRYGPKPDYLKVKYQHTSPQI